MWFLGLVGRMFSGIFGVLKMVPFKAWAAIAIAGAAWFALNTYVNKRIGEEVYIQVYAIRLQEQADKIKLAKQLADLKAASEQVTERVVVEYRDRVKIVRVAGETIIKEVPVYVTPENDAACPVNAGFVSLWNHANQGTVPGAPTGADAAPSGVKLSGIATQHAREAQYCREVETQLTGLQDWVTAQQALYGEP